MARRIVDLTMRIGGGTRVFPGYPTPIVHPWTRLKEDGYYSVLLLMVDHTATHVDAPAHFIEGADTVDSIPLEKFMGRGIALDFSNLPPRGLIRRNDVETQLRKMGVEPGRGWFVLFRTGYDEKVDTPDWLNHPSLDEECAKYLASLGVSGVGIDAPSVDHIPFPAHRVLLSHGVLIYENLTNMREIVGRTFDFLGIPLRIERGSGSPVRAMAILE